MLPIIILIYFFTKYLSADIEKLGISQLLKKWLVIFLLALCWVKTFNHYILPIDTGITIKSTIDLIINIIQAFSIIYVVIEILSKLAIHQVDKGASWIYIVLFALPSILSSVLAWLSFYPGIINNDTVYILTSIQVTHTYDDIHPIAYTMLIRFLLSIWNSPAVLVLFQILLTGFAMGFTGWALQKTGLPNKYCWAAILAMALLPVTWMYAVTILKDTIYTLAMLIFIDIIMLAVVKKDEILGSIKWYAYALAVGLFAMLMRHNGILAVLGTLLFGVVLFLAKHKKEWAIKTFCVVGAAAILFFGMNGIIMVSLGDHFKKQEASPLLFTQPIHQIVSIYGNHKDQMDSATLTAIDDYLNIDYVDECLFGSKSLGWGRGYYFQNVHKSVDWSELNGNKNDFFKLWIKLVKKYPHTAFISSQRLNSIVWYSNNDGFTAKYLSDINTDDIVA